MRTSTSLIRIRFPCDLLERLDRLAERLRLKDRRRIPRAALVRALVQLHMGDLDDDRRELTAVLGADPVRRGQRKKRPEGEERTTAKPTGERRHPLIRAGGPNPISDGTHPCEG